MDPPDLIGFELQIMFSNLDEHMNCDNLMIAIHKFIDEFNALNKYSTTA